MFENRALPSTLNLLAEIHYLQSFSPSLCVGDKVIISFKRQRKGCKNQLSVFIEHLHCYISN